MTIKTFFVDVVYHDHAYIEQFRLALETINFRVPCFIESGFNNWEHKIEVAIACNKEDADFIEDVLIPFI